MKTWIKSTERHCCPQINKTLEESLHPSPPPRCCSFDARHGFCSRHCGAPPPTARGVDKQYAKQMTRPTHTSAHTQVEGGSSLLHRGNEQPSGPDSLGLVLRLLLVLWYKNVITFRSVACVSAEETNSNVRLMFFSSNYRVSLCKNLKHLSCISTLTKSHFLFLRSCQTLWYLTLL